jgi:hypothetical protein
MLVRSTTWLHYDIVALFWCEEMVSVENATTVT